MTIQAVANHVGVSWDVVKDIQKQRLWRLYRKPRLKGLKEIAIDEICIGKGHKYLTLVLDLRTGRVVFVGDGKGAEALQPFWTRLKKSRARIQAVAIDMSNAYIQAVTENIPEAKIVFDRFHIVKMFNDKITEYRRQLFNRLKDPTERKLLKGTRWLLLKNPENLNPEKNERERLDQALEINKPLATIYYMREDLRQYWKQANRASAAAFLQDWIQRAKASGINVLEKFADTLIAHRDGILAYYDYPITTAPLEGTNNKIKTMKRQAYGFRDKKFFKLKIMGIHETKYALVG
jgi:transposase